MAAYPPTGGVRRRGVSGKSCGVVCCSRFCAGNMLCVMVLDAFRCRLTQMWCVWCLPRKHCVAVTHPSFVSLLYCVLSRRLVWGAPGG